MKNKSIILVLGILILVFCLTFVLTGLFYFFNRPEVDSKNMGNLVDNSSSIEYKYRFVWNFGYKYDVFMYDNGSIEVFVYPYCVDCGDNSRFDEYSFVLDFSDKSMDKVNGLFEQIFDGRDSNYVDIANINLNDDDFKIINAIIYNKEDNL